MDQQQKLQPFMSIHYQGQWLKSVALVGDIVLGRGAGCDIRLDDRAVSREQLLLKVLAQGGGVHLENKSQFKPFLLNGVASQQGPFKPGDRLEIGPYLLELQWGEPKKAGLAGGAGAVSAANPQKPGGVQATEQGASQRVPVAAASPSAAPGGIVSLDGGGGETQALPAFPETEAQPEKRPDDPKKSALAFPQASSFDPLSAPSQDPGFLASGQGGADLLSLEQENEQEKGLEQVRELKDENRQGAADQAARPPAEDAGGGDFGMQFQHGQQQNDEAQAAVESPAPASGPQPGAEDFGRLAITSMVAAANSLPPSSSFSASHAQTNDLPGLDADEDTRLSAGSSVVAQLIFPAGTANYEIYEISKMETTLGRSRSCDIILNEKKSSRHNSMLIRQGLRFRLKDLSSVNGTFVNEEKIIEQALTSGDVIRIGDVEFSFQVHDAKYEGKLQKLEEQGGNESESQMVGNRLTQPLVGSQDDLRGLRLEGGTRQKQPEAVASAGVPVDSSILGVGQPGLQAQQSWLQRYQALSPARRIGFLAGICLILALVLLGGDPKEGSENSGAAHPQASPSASPNAQKTAEDATFESLTPEQKQFVIHQHDLAFEQFENRDYDRALFEIRKIFDLIHDYKDSREMEHYALENKRKQEVRDAELKAAAANEERKLKLAQAEADCQQKMDDHQYAETKQCFMEILNLDPENEKQKKWQKEIEAWEARVAENRRLAADKHWINQKGWKWFREAKRLQSAKSYLPALAKIHRALSLALSDLQLKHLLKTLEQQCESELAALLAPLLAAAQDAENQGDWVKAYHNYQQALALDGQNAAVRLALQRVKLILHERAKEVYTEGIIAESYSDFGNAHRLFEEVLRVAPEKDLYRERCERRLSHYFGYKGDEFNPDGITAQTPDANQQPQAQQGGGSGGEAGASGPRPASDGAATSGAGGGGSSGGSVSQPGKAAAAPAAAGGGS